MPTATQLAVEEEIAPLRDVAAGRGWSFKQLGGGTVFRLGIPAKDKTIVHLEVDCDGYPSVPPAWHFRDPETGALDQPKDTPKGGQFFHSSGAICAPWNRLAYKTVNPRGPHDDWSIGDWKANSYTKATRDLCSMALRIAVELAGPYTGRQSQP